jgi:rhomboid protease GluP
VHGSLRHLFMNMLSLSRVGPQAESVLGLTLFLLIYVFSGVGANWMTYLASKSPYTLGASGSLYGLLGAMAVYMLRNRDSLGRYSNAALANIRRTLAMNFIMGSLYGGGVDNWAHLGGFVAGCAITMLLPLSLPLGMGILAGQQQRLGFTPPRMPGGGGGGGGFGGGGGGYSSGGSRLNRD